MKPSQKAAVAVNALPLLEAEAKEREQRGANQYTSPVEKIPEGSKGRARDKAAELVGVNPRYVSDAATVKLTPRQKQFCALLMRGLSNKEIASELGITVAAVRTHFEAAFDKLVIEQPRSRTRLMAKLNGDCL